MISFYPGPSKVYPEVPSYVQQAYDAGLLSINHRSPEFMAIFQKAANLVKEKLAVPGYYTVLFCSSATECWEIISQSLVQQKSFHVYNGAFGEKWHRYASQLVPVTDSLVFEPTELPDLERIGPADSADMLCLTHNETSNGTALPSDWMQSVRSRFSDSLIAVDATSSMAGVELPWSAGDIWYASVQKCFGLPAGLAVMVLSPAAVAQTKEIGERNHYNSLLSIYKHSLNCQTTHTPNVLGIYLLMRTLEQRDSIQEIDALIIQRQKNWFKVLNEVEDIKPLIISNIVASKTVIPFQSKPEIINRIREQAKLAGLTIGNGYGELKATTLRIANFPAITDKEIDRLIHFLRNFLPTIGG